MSANYELVYRAHGQLDAQMIRLFLESKGFTVLTYGESVGVTYGLTVGPLGEVEILVPIAQVEEARRTLIDMEAGKYELPPSVDTSGIDHTQEDTADPEA